MGLDFSYSVVIRYYCEIGAGNFGPSVPDRHVYRKLWLRLSQKNYLAPAISGDMVGCRPVNLVVGCAVLP